MTLPLKDLEGAPWTANYMPLFKGGGIAWRAPRGTVRDGWLDSLPNLAGAHLDQVAREVVGLLFYSPSQRKDRVNNAAFALRSMRKKLSRMNISETNSSQW